jgi:hypothetical protein
VRVQSLPDQEGTQVALAVRIVDQAGAPPTTTAQPEEPIPPSVLKAERQIEKQVHRFRGGIRTGVGLDPEVVLFGIQARLGPFFSRDLFFRPNVEFGFGEVTKMFGINLEALYRLPFTPRYGRWSAYLGGGPALNFVHRNFEEAASGADIDFGDFTFEGGLNLLGGIQYRSGMFLEMRATAWSRPTVRLILGFNF